MIGEKVVCINNESMNRITINKIYEVTKNTNYYSYYIINDVGKEMGYYKYRFITLKEYRKQKISNLLNITNE